MVNSFIDERISRNEQSTFLEGNSVSSKFNRSFLEERSESPNKP